jgi:hypothetical protein
MVIDIAKPPLGIDLFAHLANYNFRPGVSKELSCDLFILY